MSNVSAPGIGETAGRPPSRESENKAQLSSPASKVHLAHASSATHRSSHARASRTERSAPSYAASESLARAKHSSAHAMPRRGGYARTSPSRMVYHPSRTRSPTP